MTKLRTYQCPGTETHPTHKFDYVHHPSVEADPLPRFCGFCGYDSQGVELDQPLAAPHIAKSIKGVVDTMHREMEAGADFRAAMAMEQFGLDSSEAASMRETNSRDGLREGDTSDAPVSNPVTQVMEAAPPGVFGFQGASAGLGYSSTVAAGPSPNAGAHTQAALRRQHVANTAGNGQSGAVSSSMPALETLAPGYTKRVR